MSPAFERGRIRSVLRISAMQWPGAMSEELTARFSGVLPGQAQVFESQVGLHSWPMYCLRDKPDNAVRTAHLPGTKKENG
jgi:hypothetical protein